MGVIDWSSLWNKASSSIDEAKKQVALRTMPVLLGIYDTQQHRSSLPLSQRIFLSTFLDKNKAPITERDLSEQEQNALYWLVNSKLQKNPVSGKDKKVPFAYKDYPRVQRQRNIMNSMKVGMPYDLGDADFVHSLGQFQYTYNPDDKSITVYDKYDFNPLKGQTNEFGEEANVKDYPAVERQATNNYFLDLLTGRMFGAARNYGQIALPSYGGQGIPVEIKLESPTEKLRRTKRAMKTEASRRAGRSEYTPPGEQMVGY